MQGLRGMIVHCTVFSFHMPTSQRAFESASSSSVLWRVLLIGLILRVLWALAVPVVPSSDSFMYDAFAKSLAAGQGYAYADGQLTAYWPVGTSAVYAAFYSVFGHGYVPIVVFNLLLGLALIWLTWQIAAQVFAHDQRIANIAAGLVALWPLLIQYTTVLASELLFSVLLLGSLWAWMQWQWTPWLRQVSWVVLMVGALYVRPTVLPLFVLLPVLDAWRQRKLSVAFSGWLAAALIGVVLVGPWAARNQAVFGKPVLVSTNFGINFWMGNNPKSNGGYMDPLPETPRHEVQADQFYRQLAMQFIQDEPAHALKLLFVRARITFDRESIGMVWNEEGFKQRGWQALVVPLKGLSALYWWAMLVAAVAGLVIALHARQIDLRQPLWWVAALLVAVPVLTVGQDRYHVPLNPIIAMLAALVWTQWQARSKTR
jgi:hypothetical protein